MNTMQKNRLLPILHQSFVAVIGSYAFVWGLTTLGVAGLVALGVDYHEAETTMMLLAFLVFLALFLWAIAAKSMLRVWLVLAGGAVLMITTALALQSHLTS